MEMIKSLALNGANSANEGFKVPTSDDWQVVAMGVGVVFVGLVLIILICKVMGLFFAKSAKKENKPAAAPVAATSAPIENRQEIIAAVTAACAEEMGKDISALRVISFKKL
ncbi:MAG: OadG family protein [Clostridia bacterium]|nr:OadG family protein [Clostridia bacterium]